MLAILMEDILILGCNKFDKGASLKMKSLKMPEL